MSRSVKKAPIKKDNGCGKKWAKKQANRRVRNDKDFDSNGKKYRIKYNPWNITDCRWYLPEDQAIKRK
jgi:hypothetical protein